MFSFDVDENHRETPTAFQRKRQFQGDTHFILLDATNVYTVVRKRNNFGILTTHAMP